MSTGKEDINSYYRRKLSEAKELIQIAIDHPNIVSSFSINDTISTNLQLHQQNAIIRITIDLNEISLKQLRDKK